MSLSKEKKLSFIFVSLITLSGCATKIIQQCDTDCQKAVAVQNSNLATEERLTLFNTLNLRRKPNGLLDPDAERMMVTMYLAANPTDRQALDLVLKQGDRGQAFIRQFAEKVLDQANLKYQIALAEQRTKASAGTFVCSVKNPPIDPANFRFYKITPEIVPKLNLTGPATEQSVCDAVAKLPLAQPRVAP